jgi:hypothetical protein
VYSGTGEEVTHQTYPIASSAIAYLAYDDEAGEAYVSFQKGGSYTITMPQIEVERWAAADSPGGYWNANVKGKY